MLIRCEKCSTVYELDEKVLPAGGAPVQCSRCQYIFTAHPSAGGGNGVLAPAAAATPSAAPAAQAPSAVAATAPAAPPAEASSALAAPKAANAAAEGSVAPPSSAPTTPPRAAPPPADGPRTPDGRPIRKVVFTDEDGAAAPPRMLPRTPVDAPPRAHSSGLLKWAIPLVVLAALIAAFTAWRRASQRVDPAAAQRRAEGQSLLLRDDRASLARAAVAFEDAARLDAGLFQARADRDLARALVLGLVQGEAERLAMRFEALEAAAAPTGGPEGQGGVGPLSADEAARAAAAAEAKRLRGDLEMVRARAVQLESDAAADLAPLAAAHRSDPAVLRAEAVLAAAGRDPGRAEESVRRARAAGARDAWVDLAEAAAAARAATPERRAEGVARLEALARAHPEVLRARYLVAASLARAGRVDEAIAAADAVLAANPAHDDARAVKSAAAARAPAQTVTAPEAVPPGTPAPTQRKGLSHAATDADP